MSRLLLALFIGLVLGAMIGRDLLARETPAPAAAYDERHVRTAVAYTEALRQVCGQFNEPFATANVINAHGGDEWVRAWRKHPEWASACKAAYAGLYRSYAR